MTSLKFKTSNITTFSNNAPAYLLGKNGFSTELGTIPLLVTAAVITDASSNIDFTIRGLNTLYDDNVGTHILNNNTFSSTKQISFRVLQNESDLTSEEIAYVDPYVFTSSNIIQFFTNNNIVKIQNAVTSGFSLFSKLETPPFYIKLYQILATNNFSDKSMYISGTTLNKVKYFNIAHQTGSYTADIGITPIDKTFIDVYVDGGKQSPSSFTWDNKANINIVLSNAATNLKISHSVYTVPTIELGDNIFIIYNNIYSVINSSYVSNSSKYNSILSANSVFKVYLNDNLNINATSFYATNISPNPVGVIGNVNHSNNTFTFDYDYNTYAGTFDLANNHVYHIVKGSKYTPLNLSAGRTLYNVPAGSISVRAQNINTVGRKSPYSTQTSIVYGTTLPAVENLEITESLYYDTTQGVATRAIVSFNYAPGRDILGYEISYKVEGDSTDLSNFNTVQVPASGIGSDGRIRYVINNIDRGRASGVNYLVVRVTPINNDLDGIAKEKIHIIMGKLATPDNVKAFSYAQNSNVLTLFWDYSLNNDGTLKDLDLQEVEIRIYSGSIAAAQYLTAWNLATFIATVAIPSTSHSFTVTSYGTYTYLIKTRDTSRIESTNVQGFSVVLLRPTNLSVHKVWSEDYPSANDSVAYFTNENYNEYYWPSFSNSDNSGLYYAVDDPITPGLGPATNTENANGVSSGFSVAISATDLLISSNAFYQTAVRDVGQIVNGKLTLEINSYTILASTWLSMKENLVSGVSDVSVFSNVLHDSGSGIGTFLSSAVYNDVNKTLASTDSFGNVYAIWNSGQYSGDTSNANSFALIAGVINADAIALSYTYKAAGVATLTNSLANISQFSSSYQLVNLKQWGDPEGLGNWQGPDNLVSYNAELRYSTNNVYFTGANANVNVTSFSSSNTGSFALFNSGEIEFRWFQFKLNFINYNPSLASVVLDKVRYSVDLTDKNYATMVNVVSNPTIITFVEQGFRATPIITLTPIIDSPLRVNNTFPSYSSINSNATQANITVYTNTGVFVSGVRVNFSATGI